MNWIKRLFRLFKDEEDYIDEDSGQQLESTPRTPEVKSNREKGKEVDAKIVYQYPKGAFRFPLVPDDDKDTRSRPAMNNEQEQPIRRPEQSIRRPEQPIRRQEQPRRNNSQETVEPIRKRRQEQEPNHSRPFKPTNIPSPIFGYKDRPEIRTGSILQRGVEDNVIDRKDSVNRELYHRYSQTFNGEPVIMKPGEKRFNPLELDLAKAQSEQEAKIQNTTQDGVQQVAENTQDIVVQKVREIEEKETLDKATTDLEEITTDPIEQAVFAEKVDSPVSHDKVEEAGPDVVVIEDDELEPENLVKVEEVEVEVAAASEEVSTAVREEMPESDEQLSLVDETIEKIQAETFERDISKYTESEDSIPDQEPASARSTIPFNVIMLNQDKQRLKEKEMQKLSSVEHVKPEQAFVKGETEDKTVVIADQSFQVIAQMEETKPSSSLEQESPQNDLIEEDLTRVEAEQRLFSFPTIDLLTPPVIVEENSQWIEDQKELLNTTLKNFNVGAAVVNVTQGPSVTRFEVQPEPGVKVNKITNLSDDIKLSLAARDIRIEAPIPGKHTIGIEVPNTKSRPVYLSEIVSKPEFIHENSPLAAALGLDISGKPIVSDLRKMPHGLIAGATGSGKSVCINTILVSFLYKAKPEDLKLLLIDPKMVELAPYNHIPHLVSPVITDVKAATAALKWAVEEMERRYELFAHTGVRDIGRFNELAEKSRQYADKLPYIVIIIDELADLMMMSPADVEEAICRIAQKARACGIHLIIATQRPSVDVITGLIKANIPTRIAFSVSSQVDSRTIIDVSGAEKLLGRGDMLFLENGSSKPIRLQGTFVSDEEIDEVVAHARGQGEPNYLFEQDDLLKKAEINETEDELFFEACEFVIESGGASSSMLQRRFKIGYNRAARLIDMMESHGYISESRGSKPRDVFITDADLESLQMANKSL